MKGTIYKITNTINNKVYIGKTYSTIERRFGQHKRDSRKDSCKDRPLYKAMNKYGIENFVITELGKFDNLEEKEMEFIKEYDSYKNGYNATLGGDGKRYIDLSDDYIIDTYKKLKSLKATSKELGISVDTIKNILRNNSIEIKRHVVERKVLLVELDLKFNNTTECANYLIENNLIETKVFKNARRGVNRALDGSRNGFNGYTFKLLDDEGMVAYPNGKEAVC